LQLNATTNSKRNRKPKPNPNPKTNSNFTPKSDDLNMAVFGF